MIGPYCLSLLGLIASAATMNAPEQSIRKFLTSPETPGQQGGQGVLEFMPGFGKLPVPGKWMLMMAIVIVIGLMNELFR